MRSLMDLFRREPSANLAEGSRPDLVLVIPDHLTESDAVRALVGSVREVRTALGTRVRMTQAERTARPDDDEVRGRCGALVDLAALFDEVIAERLGLWDEYCAQTEV